MTGKLYGWASRIGLVSLVVVLVLSLNSPATAGMRFRVGISYLDGFRDLMDQYEDNVQVKEHVEVDETFVWPVGISLSPYYQWDNGLMVGAGIGPFMYLLVDGWDTYSHWQLPVSANIGYVLGPDNPVSVYVRGGPSYHFAGGDFYEGSNLGVTAAVGLEFFQTSHFRMGVEAAYDSAEVEIDNLRESRTKDIKAAEFSFSLFFLFK